MGLRTWVKQRLNMAPASASVDLLAAPPLAVTVPRTLGLDLTLPERSWSVARLEGLFKDAAQRPSQKSMDAARVARHRLSMFWLSAPVDQLEVLYSGPLGALQRLQLKGPLCHQPLSSDERQWRQLLADRIVLPAERSRLLNLILALMPYTGPGKFNLANADVVLPDWLLSDYAGHCDPVLKQKLQGPVGYLNPAADVEVQDDVALPQLCSKRGQEALELLKKPETVRQAKALVTLFGMAPEDGETLQELSGLRCMLAQLWLDVDPNSMASLYSGAVGDLTASLIRAGFGGVLVDDEDQLAGKNLRRCAEELDVSEPSYHGLILATLLYFPPNKIDFSAISGLPNWLVNALEAL